MPSALDEISARIREVGNSPPYLFEHGSFLHAYIACLTADELCEAIVQMIGEPAPVRMALRNRLLRLLRERKIDQGEMRLVTLVERTATIAEGDWKLRQFVDALHSAIFEYLPLPAQHALIERWTGRSNRVAAGRWLKAVQQVPALFEAETIGLYWRASRDIRAAKSLAYEAPPEALTLLLPEFVEAGVEGWIVSKAALRATRIDELTWVSIKERIPATYLYLCAKLDRDVGDNDAYDLALACSTAGDGGVGLAIWSIGQMRKVAVLDRLLTAVPEMERHALSHVQAMLGEEPSRGIGIDGLGDRE